MNMKSGPPGTSTFHSEITNIESAGFWLLVDGREYFVPFEDYPVFRSATLEQIFDVRRIGPGQYHWPSLDADVELNALEHPEHYPMIWRDRRK